MCKYAPNLANNLYICNVIKKIFTVAPYPYERHFLHSDYSEGGRIASFDILRMAMIMLVVYLHVWPEGSYYMQWAIREVVIVLFVISGYFLADKDGRISTGNLKLRASKILRIAIWSQAVYLCIFLAELYVNNPVRFVSYTHAPGNFGNILLVGDSVAPHLWYLNSYLFALAILAVTLKFKADKLLIAIAAAAYLCGLLLGTYGYMINIEAPEVKIWSLHRTVLNMALPSMLGGVYLRRLQHRLPDIKLTAAIMICCYAMLFAETMYAQQYSDKSMQEYFLLSLPTALVTVAWVSQLRNPGKAAIEIGKFCATNSLCLYLWHFLIMQICERTYFLEPEGSFSKLLIILLLTITVGGIARKIVKIFHQKIKKTPQSVA